MEAISISCHLKYINSITFQCSQKTCLLQHWHLHGATAGFLPVFGEKILLFLGDNFIQSAIFADLTIVKSSLADKFLQCFKISSLHLHKSQVQVSFSE